jgi:hypothetical protein
VGAGAWVCGCVGVGAGAWVWVWVWVYSWLVRVVLSLRSSFFFRGGIGLTLFNFYLFFLFFFYFISFYSYFFFFFLLSSLMFIFSMTSKMVGCFWGRVGCTSKSKAKTLPTINRTKEKSKSATVQTVLLFFFFDTVVRPRGAVRSTCAYVCV